MERRIKKKRRTKERKKKPLGLFLLAWVFIIEKVPMDRKGGKKKKKKKTEKKKTDKNGEEGGRGAKNRV